MFSALKLKPVSLEFSFTLFTFPCLPFKASQKKQTPVLHGPAKPQISAKVQERETLLVCQALAGDWR